jgi:hypothetical protein
MSFFPPDKTIPAGLQTEAFTLLPLSVSHAALDYEAVMTSQEMLRLWSGSPWPPTDFTLADNTIDLAWHAQEHRQKVAFTYTVLDPGQETCLGCVYIRPLAELVDTNPGQLLGLDLNEAMARFWIRASLLPTELDKQLLAALCSWFRNHWPFSRLYFHTRRANLQQVALFEAADLAKRLTLQYPGRGGEHHFYELADNT